VASFWDDFRALLKEPLALEAIAVVGLFLFALLAFRRIRGIAAELERRKALADYVRGLDDFLRGEFRVAIATLEEVLKRDPENVEARIALGDCYREVGDAAEAKKHHHHVHRVFGHEMARNFLSLGRDELALKNYDKAVEAFDRTLELSPGDRDALAGLAQSYAEGGNPVDAAETLRILYPQGPAPDLGVAARREASRRFADAGAAMLREAVPARAIAFYVEAIAFQKENVRARTGLMRAAQMLGDVDQARAMVEEQLRELRELSSEEGVLFEPAAARSGAEAGEAAPAPPESFLPAKLADVGGVVAAVQERTARYACSACGMLQRSYAEACPSCSAVGTLEALPELNALYTMPLKDFRAAVDEVEGNAAHVQALARKGSLGDEEALRALLEQGARVIYDVFAALPALEGRRFLGERLGAALGLKAAREVRECHAARGRLPLLGGTAPHDEFAAAFYLALPEADAAVCLPTLGAAHDAAVAGVLADARVGEAGRDAAARRLAARGLDALVPLVEAVASAPEAGSLDRASALVKGWGAEAVDLIEKRFFTASLLGKLFSGARGARRRAAADLLARTGMKEAAEVIGRAASKEKDAALRSHFLSAKERAQKGGGG